MLNFDTYGFLQPYEPIEVDLSILEDYFVFNEHRQRLFINYMRWLDSFKSKVTTEFVQFLDGSFISQKELPKDIDFVTFFDYKIYEREERFLDKYWTFSLENEGLDSYLVKTYPKGHELYENHLTERNYWTRLYSCTRKNDFGEQFKKGFISINIK